MDAAVEIRDVTLAVRRNRLLVGASARFDSGSITSLVGPNGSGKSVLLRAICGFVRVSKGEIFVAPRFFSKGSVFPDRFGVTIDGPAYNPHVTGFDNLMELAKIRDVIDESAIRRVMRQFDLDPGSRTRVRGYSLGMRQKLSLAQAFMESPDLLLLDEPFNALDHESVKLVKQLMLSFKAGGGTIIFTSHRGGDVEELSDSVVRITDMSLTQA